MILKLNDINNLKLFDKPFTKYETLVYKCEKNKKEYCYIVYNKRKKQCEIIPNSKINIIDILENIKKKINVIQVFISTSLKNKYLIDLNKKYLLSGFRFPFVCKETPLNLIDDNYFLSLVYYTNEDNKKKININDIIETVDKFKNKKICKLKIKFNKKTCNDMKKLLYENEEISGKFKIKQQNGIGVNLLELDKKSIKHGKENKVIVCKAIYNFHTHPQISYEKYKLKIGWPSCTDLIVFLKSFLKYNTIFHTLISMEGLYFISMDDNWINEKKILKHYIKDITKFIKQNYDACNYDHTNFQLYQDKVRYHCYKGFPLFNLKYVSWKNIGNYIYHANFNKNYEKCKIID